MFKKSVRIIFSAAVLLSMPFSCFAKPFNVTDYQSDSNTKYGPAHTQQIENQTFNGTASDPNQIYAAMQSMKVNPNWDPMDPTSSMWVYGPMYLWLRSCSLTGDTDLYTLGIGGARNVINDSTFTGDNSISNLNFNGSHENYVSDSDFNESTRISTYALKDGVEGVGTQINSSTFNDDTSISVSDGGSLQINDSTINLASDDVMSKWFGLNSNNPDSILYIMYNNLFAPPSANFNDSSSVSSLWFLVPKLGGFESDSIPSYYGSVSGSVAPSSGRWPYGFEFTSASLPPIYYRGNLTYFSQFCLVPLFSNLFYNSFSSDRFFVNESNNKFRSLYMFHINKLTASKVNERPVITSEKVYCTLPALIDIAINNVVQVMIQIFNIFADWYYPLSNLDSLYWTYYNTDTGKEERINLAGLMYNISWYLGEMYLMNDWEAGEDLAKPGQDLNDTITDLDNAESAITDTVAGHISGFAPDSSIIAGLAAIALVADWLQRIFVALGAYSVPITVSLLLGVCMQFIGYFKYKTG